VNMKKRLEKHFSSQDDTNLGIPRQLWSMLKGKIVATFTKLGQCVVNNYQLTLEVDCAYVSTVFDKST